MLRSFAALSLSALLLFCGCAKPAPASEAPAQAATTAPAAELPSRTAASSVLTEAIEIYDAQTLSGGSYTCAASGAHILLVGQGGDLQADGLTLDKSGDSAAAPADGPLEVGDNAVVAITDGGKASVNGSAITSGAAGGHALFVSGRESSAALTDTMIVSTGQAAAAFYAANGGTGSAADCELVASGENTACLFVSGGGSIACNGTQITADPDSAGSAAALYDGVIALEDCAVQGALRFSGTKNILHCLRTTLTGDIRLSAAEDEADIRLSDNSVLRGTVEGDGAIGISVALDSSSRWVLTGDAYVAALTDEDAALSNIESSGFSLYYNSELEANAWLASKTRALPGGGFLIPLI